MAVHSNISFDRRNNVERRERLVIFNHIMKCAGMSMLASLAGHFGPGHYPKKVDHYTDWRILAQSCFKYNKHATLSLGGHAVFGIETLFDRPRQVFYVTMLRRPFDLCRSLYRYSQLHFARPRSFYDYTLEDYPANLMVKTLADGNLELAKERLSNHYFHFGLVDRFRQGMTMLRHHLGLAQVDYPSVNASYSLLGPIDCDNELEAAFADRNAMDMELYRFASALFDKRYARFAMAEDIDLHNRTGQEKVAPALEKREAEPILKLLRSKHIARAVEKMAALPPLRRPYREMARYLAALGRVDDALDCLERGMTDSPWLKLHGIEICEKAGRIDQAVTYTGSVLEETLPYCTNDVEDAYPNRISYDMLVTLARLHFIQGMPSAGFYRRANEILPLRMRPRYKGEPLGDWIPLGGFSGDKGRVLVMRFGPMPVLEAFTGAVKDSGLVMDILIQPSVSGNLAKGCFNKVYPLPKDRFVFDDDLPRLSLDILGKVYDRVVVLCNDQDLLTYDQVFRLCAALSCSTYYVYPMGNHLADPQDMKFYIITPIVDQYNKAQND